MKPPELPLRDLHLPEATGFWPLAPGWWLLIALAFFGLLWLIRQALIKRARGAARRYALRRLAAYEKDYMRHGNAVTFGTQLSELLRRTMLAYAPRADVAGLVGDDWLAWLDRDLEVPQFLNGDGRAISTMPYRDKTTPVDESEVAVLVDAVRLRLSTPVTEDV